MHAKTLSGTITLQTPADTAEIDEKKPNELFNDENENEINTQKKPYAIYLH